MNRPHILHSRDTELQRFWGLDLDLLGSRDVIGQFPIGGPLKPSLYISHRCWDIMCQTVRQTYSHWKCI